MQKPNPLNITRYKSVGMKHVPHVFQNFPTQQLLQNTKQAQLLIVYLLISVLLAGCLPEEPLRLVTETSELLEAPSATAEIKPTPTIQPSDTPWPTPTYVFPTMPGGYLEKAVAGEFAGATVLVDGSFTDIDMVKFKASLKAFEEATGITITYIGDSNFRDTIAERVASGNAPDVVDFSGPDLPADFVRQGKIIDPTSWITDEWLLQQYHQSWLDLAVMEGQSAGLWHRFRAKSLIWYPKDDFEAAGYQIPVTWDEMIALMDRIVAEGGTPWCIGIESGLATGWPATDWLEDFVLRTTSPQNYTRWATGELPFSSPEIKFAAEKLAEIWFDDTYVYSGTASIAYTFFGDSPAPMFKNPPGCWFHKQEPLIAGFFPEQAQPGLDYGVFLVPEIDPTYGQPMLITGDIMVMFNDRPEVRALMEYFTTPNSASGWLESGGALAAHQTADADMYSAELEAMIAPLIPQASGFYYDASDQMPPEVGTGSFWQAMTDWVSGRKDLDTVLAEIDKSWPSR